MTPLEVFLIAALTGISGYAGWVTKQYIAHLLSDIVDERKSNELSLALAEKGADAAEHRA